jgi:quercetin dioxygenase-like cupin family protein
MVRQALAIVVGLVTLAVVTVVGLDPAGARQASTATAAAASPTANPVVREVFGRGLPPAAPGQNLDLVRYAIAPGATLPIHVHPGTQVAYIESGELTYHVLLGEVPVTRDVNQPIGAPSETVSAGQTTVLHPNDSIVEAPGVVHYGENLGPDPVVILAATLFASDQPSAIVVNPQGTPVA